MTYIEHDFPIEKLNQIAQKEGNAKKPIYQIHKWWARRLGSVFRMLIPDSFTEYDESLTPEEKKTGIKARISFRSAKWKKRPCNNALFTKLIIIISSSRTTISTIFFQSWR